MNTHIVVNPSEFALFLNQYQTQDSLVIPVLSDGRAHPAANTLCLLWVYLLSEATAYLIPFSHPDSLFSADITQLQTQHKVWTPNKKLLSYFLPEETLFDVDSIEYLNTSSVTNEDKFYTNLIRHYGEKFHSHTNVNRAIPIVKWIEFCETYGERTIPLIGMAPDPFAQHPPDLSYFFLNTIAIPTLKHIESAGLHIDLEEFHKHFRPSSKRFLTDDYVHSQYLLHTTTGRPSNKFGGVNFAALNKSDDSRKSFNSRFGDSGLLVTFDYEAFHLRLIAGLIGEKLPPTSVHEYFGKQYFGTNQLSLEQYEESKRITFNALYGDTVSPGGTGFFAKVKEYREKLWKEVNQNGYISSPYFHKKIRLRHMWEPSESKLFNYLIQATETEYSLAAIHKSIPLFNDKQSKIVLYTYDSILLDFSLNDGPELLKSVAKVLSGDGAFPVRMYSGVNYNDMKECTDMLTK